MFKRFYIDLVYEISFEKKVKRNCGTSKFEYFEDPLGYVPNQLLGDVPWMSFQDVRLGCSQDVRCGRPHDGQIGSLGDVLGTLGA